MHFAISPDSRTSKGLGRVNDVRLWSTWDSLYFVHIYFSRLYLFILIIIVSNGWQSALNNDCGLNNGAIKCQRAELKIINGKKVARLFALVFMLQLQLRRYGTECGNGREQLSREKIGARFNLSWCFCLRLAQCRKNCAISCNYVRRIHSAD